MTRRLGFLTIRAKLVPILLAVALATLAFAPIRAWAKDYSISRVDIDATVATDGSLSVNEMREFNFDGSFHGVYWDIPTGSYEGREVSTTIGAVGELVNGQFIPFTESETGNDGTYTVYTYSNYIEVKLYSAHEDETARFVINYTDANLASRYNDTAELYWKFVSDGWEVESQNVTCTVHLPVAAGASVVGGDNVRAWGHGPLDATVSFNGNDIVYQCPGVGSSEYAEARIAFPQEWLSAASTMDSNRLDSILSEEQSWADEANAKRARARVVTFGLLGMGVALSLGSIAFALTKYRKYRKAHTPQFDDKYFRDVPTDDHPAVLGALYHDGKPQQEDLTASLMRLTDLGCVRLDLEKVTRTGLLGMEHTEEDYRLSRLDVDLDTLYRRRGTGSERARKVDRATLKLMFDKLGHWGNRSSDEKLYFGELDEIAKEKPEKYNDAYEDWKTSVSAAAIERRFFLDTNSNGRSSLIALGVVDGIAAVITFFLTVFFGLIAWYFGLLLIVALVVGAVVLFVVADKSDDLSSEAVEVKAKLDALRRWLTDFTRLEEAVPQDVVLWNNLLVMAVVLGVSDRVIEQLKVAAPQVLEDPGVAPVYGWYYYHGAGMDSPVSSFGNSMSHAHSVSTAELASSSSSSGGGGGGGFSGGGGGGFGGGGGGGAF